MARKKQKLKIFTNTSDKPYDRHKYRMVMKTGKAIVLDDYELCRNYWWQYRQFMDHIDVLDK